MTLATYRQPAALLERDMEAPQFRLLREEDKLDRALSRKMRVIRQRRVNVMAEQYEAKREERAKMEA